MAAFLGMIGIVQTKADDFTRIGHWGQQQTIRHWQTGFLIHSGNRSGNLVPNGYIGGN